MTLHMWRVILLYKEYHKTILQEKKGLIEPFKNKKKKKRKKQKEKKRSPIEGMTLKNIISSNLAC